MNPSRLTVWMLTLGLAACASSPLPALHMLASEPMAARASASPAAPLRIVIAQTVVPQSVDRPQLVVRKAQGQVAWVESERWAEPLERAIPRVVAAQLEADLGDAIVWSSTSAAPARPDIRLTLEVTRFESALGSEAAVEVLWLARAGSSERSGRTAARRPAAGSGYDGMVTAYRECLQAIGRDIAAALQGWPPGIAAEPARR